MKTVKELTTGETLLVSAKLVNGGKVQLEFAEIIKNPNTKSSSASELIGMLNASDARFNSAPKARRAWMSAEKADILTVFGIDTTDLTTVGQTKELNLLNPTVNKKALKIQVTETVKPTEYQAANLEASAKRAGADGDFITSKGAYIFSNTTVVIGEAKHTFLEADDNSVAGAIGLTPIANELTA